MTNESPAESQTPRNQILEDAWFRFAKYDKNALIAQKRFVRQRKWILILGVAATTLAVMYSVFEPFLLGKTTQVPPWLLWLTQEPLRQNFLDGFHFLVIAVPIISTVLIAFSEKFNMGISWVMLRSSAEAIKKEIYRYRMQVDEYNPADTTSAETRDVRLAKKLKVVSKRLMETPVNQTDLLPYKGDLPPKFGTPENDNGFGDMTAEQYLTWRVEDQFSYYQKKAARLGRDLRRFQLLIIFLGGFGAFLAAINLNVWLAVSNALAVAFTSYLEFKRTESTVISCNLAASDLYDIRIWWHALSPEARTQRANVETLVHSTESVLQTENAGWLQEMREALAEIYKEKKEIHDEISATDVAIEVPVEAVPTSTLKPDVAPEEPAPVPAAVDPTPAETPVEVSQTATALTEQPELTEADAIASTKEEMPEPGVFTEPSPEAAPAPSEEIGAAN